MLKVTNNPKNGQHNSLELIRGKGLYFLGRREYSQLELQKKLQEKFPERESDIQEVIQEFITKGWISDIRYAEEMVREKALHSGWGPIRITQHLKEKGVEREIILSALEMIFPEAMQRESATRLAVEKRRFLHKKTASQQKVAVQRFLISRGFPFPLVLEVTEFLT